MRIRANRTATSITFLALLVVGISRAAKIAASTRPTFQDRAQDSKLGATVVSGTGQAVKLNGKTVPLAPQKPLEPGWKVIPNKEIVIRYSDHREVRISRKPPRVVNGHKTPDLYQWTYVDKRGARWTANWTDLPYPITNRLVGRSPLDGFVQGGAHLAGNRLVFSPPHDGSVRPSRAAIIWAPQKGWKTVSFLLRSVPEPEAPVAESLWSQPGVAPSTGRLVSRSFGMALEKARRADGARTLEFVLLPDTGGALLPNRFQVLGLKQEQSVKAELAEWEGHPEPLKTIYRASTLEHYGLMAEAAEELDRSVRKHPTSSALLRSAVLAHRRTGNQARADELSRRLPIGEPMDLDAGR